MFYKQKQSLILTCLFKLNKVTIFCYFCLASCSSPSTPSLITTSVLYQDKTSSLTNNEVNKSQILGTNSHNLSEDFIKKLKFFTSDQVLNKSEIESLSTSNDLIDKNFISVIKNKESFEMSDPEDNNSKSINFIINKDFNIDAQFIKKISDYIKDGILDIEEINTLKKEQDSEGNKYIDNITSYDSYYNFPLFNLSNKIKQIKLQLYYDENTVISGDSQAEIVSNIGQGDRLEETTSDNSRCGAGLIINALLLNNKNQVYDLSKKLGIGFTNLTYKNIHLLQDKLHNQYSTSSGFEILEDKSNKKVIGGTFFEALKAANIKWNTDLLTKTNGTYQESFKSYFSNSSKAMIVLPCFQEDNKLNFTKKANHCVLISFSNGKYYLSDTGKRNGTGFNHTEISSSQLNEIYNSTNSLIKISV